MPKHDFLSPKAISNRIKSKGLQKLRWFCQMCQKQCRDENGFKCHITSESHQRQLLLVAENPGKYVHAFSEEFLHDFMILLSRQYGTRRVNANEVYQDYIKDKNHFHMNATRWTTLTGFVMWLGKQGMCEVDPTPKGWFIRYIDRSPDALARQTAAAKKSKMDRDDEERSQKIIEEQIMRAEASKGEETERVYTELQRSEESEKVVLSLFKPLASNAQREEDPAGDSEEERGREEERGGGRGEACGGYEALKLNGSEAEEKLDGFVKPKLPAIRVQPVLNVFQAATSSKGRAKKKEMEREESRKRKRSALETIRDMEEQRKEKMNRRDNWIAEGIVVKVMHKKMYYRQKAVVEEVKDPYTAIVRMLESGDKVKFDQAHLETVIPAIGKPVMVVNGAYRGVRAVLETMDTSNFCVSVRIDQGPARGRLVEGVHYEDISKLYITS